LARALPMPALIGLREPKLAPVPDPWHKIRDDFLLASLLWARMHMSEVDTYGILAWMSTSSYVLVCGFCVVAHPLPFILVFHTFELVLQSVAFSMALP